MPKESITCPACGIVFHDWPGKQRKACSRACFYRAFPHSNNTHHTRPIEERFWEKVQRIDDADSCWPWLGAKHGLPGKKYGHIIFEGKDWPATAISWLLHFGEFDRSFDICHSCDNPPCVRPSHLFLGTRKENIMDAAMKRRMPFRISPEDVQEARRLHAEQQLGSSVLARRFGISQPQMSKILLRQSRDHIV